MSVLAVISVIALLIFVHELGHFLAARLQGIHVNRFSIGFGPILWKFQGSRTEYALRALPLGGFVGFPMDEDSDTSFAPDDPNLLQNRPVMDRAIVMSAGVIANLLFAYLVFVIQFTSVGVPQDFIPEPGVLIPQVMSNTSPAAQAGIKAGDIILSVENQPLNQGEENVQVLIDAIQTSPNKPVDLLIQRGKQELNLTVTPDMSPEGTPIIGVQLYPNGRFSYERSANPIEVLTFAADEFQNVFVRTAEGFFELATNFSETSDQVSSPVRIVEQGSTMADANIISLFPFTALISVNLAIINILPLPALDGGQLAFLLVEALLGKPLPRRIQESVMQTGLLLFLCLGSMLIVRDISRLEIFQNVFQ
ncbi:RIP metalloprotease RseP [Leptolyngbyaceae cyanobacterium CCMR0082]|uniref:Zinc metalloprotease n=2 Tax=Adonisia turfae TaxID=2950184 RepID=A0A6M0SGJ7_9CYAN|nr:RIP metalloprotease RseP [Adonisia turfae]MDV3353265.1 RIP metalloprotease RseP [Leptothoe sp. LEGE 181152]NEZ56876.1 RIP metalloprotease RseP [Adonisia turfae CCMR0081]NEZ67093.1 RIP metalloprotease RseP [Adonisia turfae CCMR0082]